MYDQLHVTFIRTVQQIYYMTTTAQQFQLLKQHLHRQEARKAQTQKVRTINTIKWKGLMLQIIDKITRNSDYDQHLMEDVKTIIGKLPEETFIEAIINMQPLKPQFTTSTYHNTLRKDTFNPSKNEVDRKESHQETVTNDSILKQSELEEKYKRQKIKEKQELLTIFIEEKTLSKLFSSPAHPYSKIIEGWSFLLQSKYKMVIEKGLQQKGEVEMEKVCDLLQRDMMGIQKFFKMASSPIVDIFSTHGEKMNRTEDLISNFIVTYLRSHQRICATLRKILRYASKNSKQIKLFAFHCPNEADIDKFDIPSSLKIQGCYLFAANQIIQFTNILKGKQSLEKLAAIRQAFYHDINDYAKTYGGKFTEVSSEAQLQIFKFLMTKLKVFSSEIYSQLKFLQILYGEEQIGFHGESSYIHSQILVAMEAIIHNL